MTQVRIAHRASESHPATNNITVQMNVVVVESPAKAKTINKYLGKDFHVLASFGHMRDLPAKDGSVRPDDDFAMDWDHGLKSSKERSRTSQRVERCRQAHPGH
jgi:DNA topoisomerase IA